MKKPASHGTHSGVAFQEALRTESLSDAFTLHSESDAFTFHSESDAFTFHSESDAFTFHSEADAFDAFTSDTFAEAASVKPRMHTHALSSSAPASTVSWCSGQAPHDAFESVALCVPAGHGTQLLSLARGSQPGLQMQSASLLAFVNS